MTNQDSYYRTRGIRTRQGTLWMVSILGVLMINVVAVYAVFTDQPLYYLVLQLVYVFSLVLLTIWFLSRLGALEKERPKPDDGMKLAFQCATLIPLVGYTSYLILLL